MALRVVLISKGRVQGVGYRMYVYHAARRLRVGGTVRNMPDGTVETVAIVEDEDQLSLFIKAIGDDASKTGVIRVDDITIVDKKVIPGPPSTTFTILS